MQSTLGVGTKVKIKSQIPVPEWSTFDDDKGRCSASVKKKLREKFYHGDLKISAEIVYVAKESDREKLRRQGRTKVRLRDPSGSSVVITVDLSSITRK